MPNDFSGNVTFLLVVIASVGGLWWRIEAAIGKAKAEALKQASAAGALATLAQSQLAEHKLHVAESYITKAGLRETTEQVIAAVNGVRDDVHSLNERMDRIIENRQPPARQRRAS